MSRQQEIIHHFQNLNLDTTHKQRTSNTTSCSNVQGFSDAHSIGDSLFNYSMLRNIHVTLDFASINISCRTDVIRTMHATGTGYTHGSLKGSTYRYLSRYTLRGSFLCRRLLRYGTDICATRQRYTIIGGVGRRRLVLGRVVGYMSPTVSIVRRCPTSSP